MTYFNKYQGTGNDFIIIDDREQNFAINRNKIKRLCDRRFGIGADGLILLQNEREFDFKMVYFNSDGRESSMCGNGGRCIVAFANKLGIIGNKTSFVAIDGAHEAIIDENSVKLKMGDVVDVEVGNNFFYLNTGSPHYVAFIDNVGEMDLVSEAKKIRFNDRFKAEGTNVNFVTAKRTEIKIRTYERGVEAETLSCGTGAVACAIASNIKFGECINWQVEVEGGALAVKFEKKNNTFNDIWLSGAAVCVFEGEID